MKKFIKLLEEIKLSKNREDDDHHKSSASSGSHASGDHIKIDSPAKRGDSKKGGQGSSSVPKGKSSVHKGGKDLS